MGHSVDQLTNLARDTSALFTGGAAGEQAVSGGNVGKGAALDLAGLGAGAGIAASGLADAGIAAGAGGGAGGAPLMPAAQLPADPTFGGALQQIGPGEFGAAGTAPFIPSSALPAGIAQPASAGTAPAPSGGATPGFGGNVPPAAPAGPAGAAPAAGGGSAAPSAVTGADHGGIVSNILQGMQKNAGLLQLGLGGASLAMAGQQRPIPNQQQLNDLAATGSQAAKDLIGSYRSGQVSAAQQASLDQLTQQTKNQINQYFAQIGQSDSTAHMQALAQVDQQALGMKQQMLDNMLQQGLSAIGVAQGPLGTIANYQVQQDKNLSNAFGNFANAVGQAFGKQAGTTTSPTPQITGQTPSTGVAMRGPTQPGATGAQQSVQ